MTPQQKDALVALLDRLSAADLEAVTRFAEFLFSRQDSAAVDWIAAGGEPQPAAEPAEIPPPEDIPRPDDEKVVAAVKRLSKTYFMLDKKTMLGVTSDLVTQHILHGREAAEVIDELESLFEQHYLALKQGGQDR
jgi:hypothetical protein